MHPPYDVAAGLDHKAIGVVAEPCRHSSTYARPFICGALGIAMHHDGTVVQINYTISELCFAEARRSNDAVALVSGSVNQACLHIVKLSISPRPEMQVPLSVAGLEGYHAVGWNNSCRTHEPTEYTAVAFLDSNF